MRDFAASRIVRHGTLILGYDNRVEYAAAAGGWWSQAEPCMSLALRQVMSYLEELGLKFLPVWIPSHTEFSDLAIKANRRFDHLCSFVMEWGQFEMGEGRFVPPRELRPASADERLPVVPWIPTQEDLAAEQEGVIVTDFALEIIICV